MRGGKNNGVPPAPAATLNDAIVAARFAEDPPVVHVGFSAPAELWMKCAIAPPSLTPTVHAA